MSLSVHHPGSHWCLTHCQSPPPVSPATANTSLPASETSGSVLVDKDKWFRRRDNLTKPGAAAAAAAEWYAFV